MRAFSTRPANRDTAAALFLTASLALSGCERPSGADSNSEGDGSSARARNPEVAQRERLAGGRVMFYERVDQLERMGRVLRMEALVGRSINLLIDLSDKLVAEDERNNGGLANSNNLPTLRLEVQKVFLEIKRMSELPGPEDIADMRSQLVKLGALDYREMLPPEDEAGKRAWSATGPSDLRKLGQALRSHKEKFAQLDANSQDLRASPNRMPELSFTLPVNEAKILASLGKLSASSQTFTTAYFHASNTGSVNIGYHLPERPTAENWHGFFYVISGGQEFLGGYITNDIKFETAQVFVRLNDNNLLRITQEGPKLQFAKNSAGYGEGGADASIGGFGAGVDIPVGGLYGQVSFLEALAYVDGDWTRIMNAVTSSPRLGTAKVDPELVSHYLTPLATDDPALASETQNGGTDVRLVSLEKPGSGLRPPRRAVPVFLALKDQTLVRISGYGEEIRFSRTASGYAVAGGRIVTPIAGAGLEAPMSHVWIDISAAEALAYFDNNPDPMFQAARKQARRIPNSVWPQNLLSVLNPDAPPPTVRVRYLSNPAPYLGEPNP